MKKRTKIIYTLLAVCAVAAIVAGYALSIYFTDYKRNVPKNFSLYITPKTTFLELADTLAAKLEDTDSFEKCFKRENPDCKIAPGFYTFTQGTTNKVIARTITKGWQTPYRLTLSGNIRGKERLAGVLGRKMMHDSTAFINCFNNPQIWEKYGFKKETFISIVIPNTYEIYWTETPEEFVARMKREYDKFWNDERVGKAKALGLGKEEVSTLASIVCEESNYKPELSAIAGVYINRLKMGMKLDADPTVKFAHNDPTIKRILYRHLTIDSPYNTYRIYGLPPGPITIPSIAGIDAVLNYQKHNYLYFCANEKLDGTHKFARTLTEHSRNARAYQAAISRL